MKVPKLKVVGVCGGKCGQEVASASGLSADFHLFNDQSCSGVGYSFRSTRLVVETDQEAMEVAMFLTNDTTVCFDQPWSRTHSMNCGDGERCHALRARLGRALAVYYIEQYNRPSAPEGTEGDDTARP